MSEVIHNMEIFEDFFLWEQNYKYIYSSYTVEVKYTGLGSIIY